MRWRWAPIFVYQSNDGRASLAARAQMHAREHTFTHTYLPEKFYSATSAIKAKIACPVQDVDD